MFKYVKAFFKGLYKILFSYPKIRKYQKHKDRYSREERYAFLRKLIKIFFKSFNVEVNAKGLEKLDPNETYLFVSNHQSMADALTLIYLIEKPMSAVAKIETLKFPIVGRACDMVDIIFIDRDNIRDAVKMLKTSKEFLNNGVSVAIYPEGTRTKDENFVPAEYKSGALKPAYETKSKIAVIAIDGSYKVFSKKYKKDIKINFEVVDVLDFEDYGTKNTNDLAQEIYTKTVSKLEEIRKQ